MTTNRKHRYLIFGVAALLASALIVKAATASNDTEDQKSPITPSRWAELVDPIYDDFPARPLLGGVEVPALTRHLAERGISWSTFRAGAKLALSERDRVSPPARSSSILDWDPASGTDPLADNESAVDMETSARFELIEDLLERLVQEQCLNR